MQKHYRLAAARDKLNLTHEEMAKKLGISRTHYTNLENGHKRPSGPLALRLSALTGLPMAIFFSDDVTSGDIETSEAESTPTGAVVST